MNNRSNLIKESKKSNKQQNKKTYLIICVKKGAFTHYLICRSVCACKTKPRKYFISNSIKTNPKCKISCLILQTDII